jgi:hypothetical protein
MDFGQNLKAFLKNLPLSTMTGHQKFLAMAALSCKGTPGLEVATQNVKKQWRKSLLRANYSPALYDRAQREGWVDPVSGINGVFVITQNGLDHLVALPTLDHELNTGELKHSGRLIIVNRKAAHTFDKFLRNILAEAKAHVLIVDSWVDETIFDNALDVIPKSTTIKLIYAQARGTFDSRAKRFSTEYPGFGYRRYKALHDRFMAVDDKGYVLGPSIKDAASNSPALIVELDAKEQRLLRSFFDDLWKKGKAQP